jgi:hypothetical protein
MPSRTSLTDLRLRAGLLIQSAGVPRTTFRTWLDRDGLELSGGYTVADAIRVCAFQTLTDGFGWQTKRAAAAINSAAHAFDLAATVMDEARRLGHRDSAPFPVIRLQPFGRPPSISAAQDVPMRELNSTATVLNLADIASLALTRLDRYVADGLHAVMERGDRDAV